MDICTLWGIKEEDLSEIKIWFKQQKHLPQNTTDEYFAMMLHSCYSDVPRTKKALEVYFHLKTTIPELFTGRSIITSEKVKKATRAMSHMLLPTLTEEGNIVIWSRVNDKSASEYVFDDTMKLFLMVVDMSVREFPGYSGVTFVHDCTNFSFKHMFKTSIYVLKRYMEYIQEASPVRVKGIHVVNSGFAASKIVALCMPFVGSEYSKIVTVEAGLDLDKFSKYARVGIDLIPQECGGRGYPVERIMDDTIRRLTKHNDWFEFDETLRTSKSK